MTTREILETRSPEAESAIASAEAKAAASLSALDGLIHELEISAATVRQHLAFEIEKAELAIERAEWQSRADLDAPRERLRHLACALEAISPEALRASRTPLAEIWQSLLTLKGDETP